MAVAATAASGCQAQATASSSSTSPSPDGAPSGSSRRRPTEPEVSKERPSQREAHPPSRKGKQVWKKLVFPPDNPPASLKDESLVSHASHEEQGPIGSGSGTRKQHHRKGRQPPSASSKAQRDSLGVIAGLPGLMADAENSLLLPTPTFSALNLESARSSIPVKEKGTRVAAVGHLHQSKASKDLSRRSNQPSVPQRLAGVGAARGGGAVPQNSSWVSTTCWDFVSPSGCARGSACKWRHGPLDDWQISWLRLQRFFFGGQLGTFEDLAGLSEAVRVAFTNEARLASLGPPSHMATSRVDMLGSALAGLRDLGYPFQVPESFTAPRTDAADGGASEGSERRSVLLASARSIVGHSLPSVSVIPVGSYAWGIDVHGSDLDVVLVSADSDGSTEPPGNGSDCMLLDKFDAKLRQLKAAGLAPNGLQAAESAQHSRSSVPVLSIAAEVQGQKLGLDVCAAGTLGSVRDAVMFRYALFNNSQLRVVLQLMKRWLRLRAVPTCREGGYPQVFWMRLTARCMQQLFLRNGVTRSNGPGVASRAAPAAAGQATRALEAFKAAVDADDRVKPEDTEGAEARRQLQAFCGQWSVALPAWGEPLNLADEEPCSVVKRLAVGVHGATALLCLGELRVLAGPRNPEELPRLDAHLHLCPCTAGFWGVFLVPGPGDEAEGTATSPELVVAYVAVCAGSRESVRHCGQRPPPGMADPRVWHARPYVSRRDTEWAFWASATTVEASKPPDATAHALQTAAAVASAADGDRCAETSEPPPETRELVLSPPHFVCQLDGSPSFSSKAREVVARLRAITADPRVRHSLPAVYPLHRYGRRLLLGFRGEAEARKLSPAAAALAREAARADSDVRGQCGGVANA
eukprot:gnl/TRDRNA2_/TRDRNA2_148967_c0_seq1.p1 gnl/TRDRNA2_/TRDRNA2_148967_c0~~gnl/TRDRNA2_/TRDRNA2_148967_c0_seq1.p1  ORF type:complete len:898 (-),score=137.31 gnl/TRDRNA2_/TRDRNA2_148967_c0_seq1:80-2671(-)